MANIKNTFALIPGQPLWKTPAGLRTYDFLADLPGQGWHAVKWHNGFLFLVLAINHDEIVITPLQNYKPARFGKPRLRVRVV